MWYFDICMVDLKLPLQNAVCYDAFKASMTKHCVFWFLCLICQMYWWSSRYYEKIRYIERVLQMYDGHTASMTKYVVLWRFDNCRVVLRLVLLNTVFCDSSTTIEWSSAQYEKRRCLVTVLQLYAGNKVSMTRHDVLWWFYNCMVVLKVILQITMSCDDSTIVWWSYRNMSKDSVLWRFDNCMVGLKVIWQNTVSCDDSTTVWWSLF